MLDEAVACYQRSINCRPNYAEAHNNLGISLREQGRLAEALAAYRRRIGLRPHLRRRAQQPALRPDLLSRPRAPRPSSRDHRIWSRRHAEPVGRSIQPHTNNRDPHRRLRVAYVSPDFRDHAESFFTVPLLSAHDHQNFEIFCYADVNRPDEVTDRIRSCVDVSHRAVGLNDVQVARLIREDHIDILVDLTHAHGSEPPPRIRPQAELPSRSAGSPNQGTTGISTIDYRLTDPFHRSARTATNTITSEESSPPT